MGLQSYREQKRNALETQTKQVKHGKIVCSNRSLIRAVLMCGFKNCSIESACESERIVLLKKKNQLKWSKRKAYDDANTHEKSRILTILVKFTRIVLK